LFGLSAVTQLADHRVGSIGLFLAVLRHARQDPQDRHHDGDVTGSHPIVRKFIEQYRSRPDLARMRASAARQGRGTGTTRD